MSYPSRPQTLGGMLYARLAAYRELLESGSAGDLGSARSQILEWVLTRYIPAVLRMRYPNLGFNADRDGIVAEAQFLVWKRLESIDVPRTTPAHPSQRGVVDRVVAGRTSPAPGGRGRGLCADAPSMAAIDWNRSTKEIVGFIDTTACGALCEAMRGLDPYKRVARERSREFAVRRDEVIARRRFAGDAREHLSALERRQLLAEVAPHATPEMLQRVEHGRVAGENEALVASETLGPEEIVTDMGDSRARMRLVEEIAALDPRAAVVIMRAFLGETICAQDRLLLGRTEGVLGRLHAYLGTGVAVGVGRGSNKEDEERRELVQRVARVDFVAAMIVKRMMTGGTVGAWERERLRSSASVVSILCEAPGPVVELAAVVGA